MISGNKIKPDNENDIPDEFKGNNLNVHIYYKETAKHVADGCFTTEPTYTNRIHIKSIELR